MKIPSQNPFSEFSCYLNFHKKMGRWQVCLYNGSKGIRRTLLYSKFKMSVRLGRVLEPYEEVDHKDRDKTNDSENNLEVVTRIENKLRANGSRSKNVVSLRCPHCDVVFTRERRQTHLIKGGIHTFCSRSCATRHQFMKVCIRH